MLLPTEFQAMQLAACASAEIQRPGEGCVKPKTASHVHDAPIIGDARITWYFIFPTGEPGCISGKRSKACVLDCIARFRPG